MISWTATKVINANYCGMRYYLTYVEKEPTLRLSVYAKGNLLHGMTEKFWEKLGTEKEVAKKSSKKKYSNAEEFALYAQGLWMRTVIGSKHSQSPIQWRFNGEEYAIKSELKDICLELYPVLMKEGPPILNEQTFRFAFEGREFTGRIDYARIRNGKVVIGDYKSGNPSMGEMRTENDPQLTLYNVGLCALCSQDDNIAEKFGLMEEREKFMGEEFYVNPDFVEEFFMLEAPYRNVKTTRDHPGWDLFPVIRSSTRTDEQFFEIIKRIESIETMINEGNIAAERGGKCDFCDVRYPCRERLKLVGAGHLEDKMGQGYLVYAIPAFARNNDQKDLFKKGPKQKKFRFSWK